MIFSDNHKLKNGTEDNLWIYILHLLIILFFLMLGPIAVTSDWIISDIFVVDLEVIGSFISVIVGVLCIIYFYEFKDSWYLPLGFGLVISGGESVLKGIIMMNSTFININSNIQKPVLLSYINGRVVFAVMILLIPAFNYFYQKISRHKTFVYWIIVASVCILLCLFILPLQESVYSGQDSIVKRPVELIYSCLFLLDYFIIMETYKKRRDFFSGMFGAAILLCLGGEFYLSFSGESNDAFFYIDIVTKFSSYVLIAVTVLKKSLHEFSSFKHEMENYRKMQVSLIEGERKCSTIIEQASDGIFIIDNNGNYLDVNSRGCSMLGYKKIEILCMNIMDQTLENDVEKVNEDLSKIHEGKTLLMEKYVKRKDGKVILVEISAAMLHDGRIMGIVRDISKKKKDEDKLIKSEKKYRTIFDLSPEYIFLIDTKSGLVIDANPAMLNCMGLSLQELRNSGLAWYSITSDKSRIEGAIKKLKEGESVSDIEISIREKSGEIAELEVNAIPVQEEGEIHKLLCVARNITERKKLEEMKRHAKEKQILLDRAMEYDKLRTEFFANISHELRTPLNVILGALQLLDLYLNECMITEDVDRIKSLSGMMKQNCYRLLRLVNNLIDLTKIDSGYFELYIQNYDIVNVIEGITDSVAKYIEGRPINIGFETNVKEKIIACDREGIKRIVLNLLSNAVKFTEQGEIRVCVRDMGGFIRISVKDTGIGIPKDKLDLIFEGFRQVDKSFTRDHEGTGIGLTIVKSLVSMHGGCVYVKSEYGSGSEFIVELPVRVLEEEENAHVVNDILDDDIEIVGIEFSDIYS